MGNSGSKVELESGFSSLVSSDEDAVAAMNTILNLVVSIEDVYEAITPDIIRSIRKQSPQKLLSIVRSFTGAIYAGYEASVGSPIYEPERKRVILNAIRILSRIIPFVNDDRELDEFQALLWDAEEVPRTIDEVSPDSVGYSVIGALMRSAFIRGFSIPLSCPAPDSSVDPNRVDGNIVWGRNGGLGGLPRDRAFYGPTKEIMNHRIEIVRFATTVLSGPLFQSMGEYRNQVPIFNTLMGSGDFVHTSNFFMSLLMTILDYETCHYGIPIVSTALTSEDTSAEEYLFTSSLNLVNILIDPPSRGEDVNVFREILSSGISDEEDICVLIKLLKTKVESLYVTTKTIGVKYIFSLREKSGFALFLFNLISGQPALIWEIRKQWGAELMHAMLSVIILNVSEPSQTGLVHTCSFILLKLSADREFVLDILSRNLLEPFFNLTEKHRLADALFIVLLKLLLTKSKNTAESLAEMWITILCNVSSLVGGALDPIAASALVTTLERMSRPGWLLAKPLRHHCVAFLLETVNTILQYQYDSSVNLVYELVLKGPKILENLDTVGDRLHVYNDEWKDRNLVEPLRSLVQYLGPRIEEECESKNLLDDEAVRRIIKRISLVGILPVPHAIVIRRFHPTEQARLWFTSFLFGTIFLSLQSMPILDWTRVKMVTLAGLKTRSMSSSADLE